MKIYILTTFFLFAGIKAKAADLIIQSVGEYFSPLKTTCLSITSVTQTVKFKFSYKGKDGRSTSIEDQCSASNRWSCYFQDEMTVWFYKGGKTALVATIIPKSGSLLEFSSSTGVLDIEKDRNLIPKVFLDFLEKKPNKGPLNSSP